MVLNRLFVIILFGFVCVAPIAAQDASDTPSPDDTADATPKLEAIVKSVRPSLVTIRVQGRDGDELGLGTGFVVDAAGLIATNLHVIMEGRPFTVELANRRTLPVCAIRASDRTNDLALIEVDAGEEVLVPLELADDGQIEQGGSVLAFGNPLGLRMSVVRGVVSAIREVEGRRMIQMAMPIEFGNSGGPLVDPTGRVHGIVNMKSAVEQSIGFAVPVVKLRELMASPNPVMMDRWVRLGRLSSEHWTTLFGADWQQRGGAISVSGKGDNFGGRSLCLSTADAPKKPFEISVSVRMDDESGAAGLVFHSDGNHQHYGFYPSNGSLRLSCFRGPSVYSWQVLSEVESADYIPGEWNELKVRIEEGGMKCYVNGAMVIESKDTQLSDGRVGLAKFRATSAEFKRFRVGDQAGSVALSDQATSWFARLSSEPQRADSISTSELQSLAEESESSAHEFKRRAFALEQQAKNLRKLAEDVQLLPVLKQLAGLLEEDDDSDLLRGALLIASLDNPDLDISLYVDRIDQMAKEVKAEIPDGADEFARLRQLDRYLFEQNGFHGGRAEYDHPANSHLNRVIDDREGLPITISILYIELARRLGSRVEGVGLPGHFVVRHVAADGKEQLIDVFDRAKRLSDQEAANIVLQYAGRVIGTDDLAAQSTLPILTRVLRNLIGSAGRKEDAEAILRYAEALVALHPDEPQFRMMRAAVRHQTGRDRTAIEDLDWLLDKRPPGMDIQEIERMRDFILP